MHFFNPLTTQSATFGPTPESDTSASLASEYGTLLNPTSHSSPFSCESMYRAVCAMYFALYPKPIWRSWSSTPCCASASTDGKSWYVTPSSCMTGGPYRWHSFWIYCCVASDWMWLFIWLLLASYHLRDARNVVVAWADKRYKVLPRILPQHPNSLKVHRPFLKIRICIWPTFVAFFEW